MLRIGRPFAPPAAMAQALAQLAARQSVGVDMPMDGGGAGPPSTPIPRKDPEICSGLHWRRRIIPLTTSCIVLFMERLAACVSRRARSRAAVAASVSAAVATERPADGACRDFHVVGYAADGVAKIKAFFEIGSCT